MKRFGAWMIAVSVLLTGWVRGDIKTDLIGYWPLDGDAMDASGNGFDGVVLGTADWVTGMFDQGIQLDGASHVEIPDFSLTTDEITFSAWIKGWKAADWAGIVSARTPNAAEMIFGDNDTLHYVWNNDASQTWNWAGAPSIPQDEWAMVALKVEPTGATAYVFSAAAGLQQATNPIAHMVQTVGPLTIGWVNCCGGGRYFQGIIDEVRVYARALSDVDVVELVNGPVDPKLADDPQPEEDALDVARDTVLSWTPAQFAATHDVYFGTAFEDVNDADRANPLDVLVSEAQAANAFDPAGLIDFGRTYYWRVDEVGAAPDSGVFKGEVWRFTAEPFAYPITQVAVTASSAHAANMGPENTINASGLNELDQHSIEPTHMWLSGMGDPTPSIQYEFDQVYKLHEMWVWNSNQLIEAFVGLGAKDVVIEYSVDGADWRVLAGATQFAQAPGVPTYTANTIVDFAGTLARYVRITIKSGYGMLPQYGLSEVRFFYIPTSAREPQPADGALTPGVNLVLRWRAGREAVSHEVVLATDSRAAANGAGTVMTSAEASLDLTDQDIEFGTTYYWTVTEVNAAGSPSAYTGEVWQFTTPDYAVLDNFDQYDDHCNRIFFTWLDGLGHNGDEDCDVAPFAGNLTGSIVGNATAPFAEKTIVMSGQSMPLDYDNATAPYYSEIQSQAFALPSDWVRGGPDTLSLCFRGYPTNAAAPLFLRVEDNANRMKTVTHPNPQAVQAATWQAWQIPMATFGALDLTHVKRVFLGVGDRDNPQAGGTGRLFIDDIRVGKCRAGVAGPGQ